MAEIVPSTLYPILFQFFSKNSLSQTLKAFKKETSFKQEGEETIPDLIKVYSHYVQNPPKETLTNGHTETATKKDKKKTKKEKKRKEPEPIEKEEQVEEEVPAPLKKKQKASKSVPAKKEEEKKEAEEQTEEVTTPTTEGKKKKVRGKKNKKAAQPKEEDEEKEVNENEEKEAIEVPKDVEKTNGKVTKEEETEQNHNTPNKKKKKATVNSPFQRVKEDDVTISNPRLADNSFWAKKGDSWGEKANQDLIVTRGKDFRHAKTKKKKGTYRGSGSLDMGVNSIKFHSEEE